MPKRKKEPELSARERELLEEILQLTWHSRAAIDGPKFRITHPGDRKALQDLEFRSLLARDKNADAYYVPLLGLDALQTDGSRRILILGDRLAEVLRERFSDETSRQKELHVAQIAECFGTSIEECLLVLLHLKEAVENWWGGSSADWPSKNAWILPSERAFEWPTIQDFVGQLKEWRSPERRELKRSMLAALDGQSRGAAPPQALAPAPEWHRDLRPRALRALFGEIHRSRQVSCPALVVLGLRAALDAMCNEMWGDLGNFQQKLQRLHDEGMIGRLQREQIAAAIDVGNATTHRGHVPTRRDADTVYDIVEGLIKQHYSLGARASIAVKRVPARVKAKKAP